MKLKPSLAALSLTVASVTTHAAVTCVVNQNTGKFESSATATSRTGSAKECDTEKASSTLRDVQQAINDAGSKLVSATVLTNTNKIPVPPPVKNEPVLAQGSGDVPLVSAGADTAQVPKKLLWEIKAGGSIRTTLGEWCESAGYKLVWEPDGGFITQAGNVFEGSFEESVIALFAAIPQAIGIKVDIAKNKLVYVTKGVK